MDKIPHDELRTGPVRWVGLGVLCGLLSVAATLTWELIATGALPVTVGGGGLLLLPQAAAVFAMIGLAVSALGRRSAVKRRQGTLGMMLCVVSLLMLMLVLLALAIRYPGCTTSFCSAPAPHALSGR